MENTIKDKINLLVSLALIDGEFSNEEKDYLIQLCKDNNFSENEISDTFNLIKLESVNKIHFGHLTDDEKYKYLLDFIQVMKIDGKITNSEVKFCENIASKLGFNKSVIAELSSYIFSNPKINIDFNVIRNIASKYLLKK